MSKVRYPEPQAERKEGKKAKEVDAEKYHKIVKSHPSKVIDSIKKVKAKRHGKKEREFSIKDPIIQIRAKNAVKKW